VSDELDQKLDALIGEIKKVNERAEKAKLTDGGREAAAKDGQVDLSNKASAVDGEREEKAFFADRKAMRAEMAEVAAEAMKAILKGTRTESLAAAIGTGKAGTALNESRLIEGSLVSPVAALKASFRDYQAGELMLALTGGDDPARQAAARAKAADLGIVRYEGLPSKSQGFAVLDSEGKATLATTNATGGFVLPNNLVDTVLKPATQRAVLQQLVTTINGVAVRGVDMPFRNTTTTRMTFQDWGATKENVNETYGSYTAYLSTIARVMDIAKQYARFSGGAAERDVIDELTRAAILGENFYMAAGTGGGTVAGVGDPTVGIYTALNAVAAYKTTPTTAASSSTLLGSFAEIITQLSGILAGRSRENQAVVVDSTTFWTSIGQGSDTAGFWASPNGPVGFARTASGGLSYFGTPIYYDANFGTSATTKIVIGGEWDVLKLYRGMEFRIDSSDVAGTRWDTNLIGFRGEEEIGFNAYPAVFVGAMQMITSVIP
jgi:HK97 family phage major capsid protein